jgi:maltooligosyltrehalose synthase
LYAGDWAFVVVPRWLAQAGWTPGNIASAEFWGETLVHLPAATPRLWSNVLTNEQIAGSDSGEEVCVKVSEILQHFPVGLLGAAVPAGEETRDKRFGGEAAALA